MAFGVRSVIQLCWTLSLILPLVRCQLDGERLDGNGSSNGTRTPSKTSFVTTNPFQDGGFVGELSRVQNPPPKTRPTEGNQEQEQRGQEVDPKDKSQPENAQLTPLVPSPSPTAKFLSPVPVVGADREWNSVLPVPTPSTSKNPWEVSPTLGNVESVIASTSTTGWAPGVTQGHVDQPTSLFGATTSASSIAVAFTTFTPLVPLVPSSSFTTPVATAVTTVVTPTSILSTQSPTAPVPASPTSPEQNQIPNSTPTAADAPQSMSAAARAGVGVGVTLVIVGIAAAVGFFLYRRRRNRRHENKDFPKSRASVRSSTGFNLLHRGTSNTDASDQEWSIESAEKVEIVCVANARSFSRNSVREIMTERPNSSQGVMKVGMTIENPDIEARQDRAKNRFTAALTSNPPSPPAPSVLKPSQSETPSASKEEAKPREGRTGSWPLQD